MYALALPFPLLGIPKEAIMDINKYIPLRTLREALREAWRVFWYTGTQSIRHD